MNITPFIQPLTPYDTTGAAKGMAANADVMHSHRDRQAQLAEQKRQFNETQPRLNFQTFGDQYNKNRDDQRNQEENQTKLLQWYQHLLETDPVQAEKSAPLIRGIFQIRGINMEPNNPDAAGQPAAEAPAESTEAAPAEPAEPPKTVAKGPAAKPYETKMDPSTKAATRRTPQQAPAAPGLSLQQVMSGYGQEPQPQEVPQPEPTPATAPPTEVQAAMAQQGQSYTGRPAPEPQSPQQAQPADVAPPAEVQSEMAQQGQPYTGQTAAEPPPPRSPGWRFTDAATGKELAVIDPGQHRALNEDRTGAVTKGMEASTLPAEDKAFVDSMMNAARQAGMNPEQTQVFIKNIVQPELDRRSRERGTMASARAMAIKAGGAGDSQKRLSYSDGKEDARNTLKDLAYPEVQKVIQQVPSMREKLKSGNYGAVMSAIYSIARSNDPRGIVTDKDFANAQTRSLWDKLSDFFSVNDPSADPNLNDDEIRRLGELVDVLERSSREAQQRIIQNAPETMNRMPSREMVDGALDGFDTAFKGVPGWDPSRYGRGKPSVGSGRGGGAGISTSDRTRSGNLSDKQPGALTDEQKRLMAK